MDINLIVTLILSTTSIAGSIMNVLKNKWGFIVWILANLGWIAVDCIFQMWGQIPIWIVYTAVSSYGFVAWHNDEKKNKTIEKYLQSDSPKLGVDDEADRIKDIEVSSEEWIEELKEKKKGCC